MTHADTPPPFPCVSHASGFLLTLTDKNLILMNLDESPLPKILCWVLWSSSRHHSQFLPAENSQRVTKHNQSINRSWDRAGLLSTLPALSFTTSLYLCSRNTEELIINPEDCAASSFHTADSVRITSFPHKRLYPTCLQCLPHLWSHFGSKRNAWSVFSSFTIF